MATGDKIITLDGLKSVYDSMALRITALESAVASDAAVSPTRLSAIAASGQADRYFSVGDIIMIPWTDRSGDTEAEYQYPFVVADIADVYDENDVKHEKAIWLMGLYVPDAHMYYNTPDRNVPSETNALDGWYYTGVTDRTTFTNGTWTPLELSAGDPIPTTYQYVYKSIYQQIAAVRYGMTRWKESDVRQWLNSAAEKGTSWWAPDHDGDYPPTNRLEIPGFLDGFSSDWMAIFKKSRVKTLYSVSNTDIIDTTYDTFFLPSTNQVYGTYQATSTEGSTFPYFIASGVSAHNSADENRVFTQFGTINGVRCWLRTYRGSSGMERALATDGSVGNDYSTTGLYLLPCTVLF